MWEFSLFSFILTLNNSSKLIGKMPERKYMHDTNYIPEQLNRLMDEENSLEIIKDLMKEGYDIHSNFDEIMLYAVKNLPTFKFLEEQGCSIYTRSGMTLVKAAEYGAFDSMQYLSKLTRILPPL